MNSDFFLPILFFGAIFAGLIGSLTGLGGGVVIVPLLVLGFGVDMRFAVGASLVAVIATSSGASAAFVREGFTNIRIAMLLQVATTAGALVGAAIALQASTGVISIIFGAILLYTAVASFTGRKGDAPTQTPDVTATRLGLNGTYPGANGLPIAYYPRNVIPAFAVMIGAGVLSALAGIGSGVVKVLAMDKCMGLPFKVSTATSNLMIGVTALASAGIYFHRGQIEPRVAAPVAVGALIGSFIGARLLPRLRVTLLRKLFAAVVLVVGGQMIVRGAQAILGGAA